MSSLEACPGAFPDDASYTSAVSSSVSSSLTTSSRYSDAVEAPPQLKLDLQLERVLLDTSPQSPFKDALANVHRLQHAADLLLRSADDIVQTKDAQKVCSRLDRLFVSADLELNSRLVRWSEKLCSRAREARKTKEMEARAVSVRMGWRHHAHAYRAKAESFERLMRQVVEAVEQLNTAGQTEDGVAGVGARLSRCLWGAEARRRPQNLESAANRVANQAASDADGVFGRAWLMRWGAEKRCKELRQSLQAGHTKLMESGKRCDWIASQLFLVEGAKTRLEVRERLGSAAYMIWTSKTMHIEDVLADPQFQSIARQYGVF